MNLSRARLLFEGGSYFSAQALRVATIRCAAIIRINTVYKLQAAIYHYTNLTFVCLSVCL